MKRHLDPVSLFLNMITKVAYSLLKKMIHFILMMKAFAYAWIVYMPMILNFLIKLKKEMYLY